MKKIIRILNILSAILAVSGLLTIMIGYLVLWNNGLSDRIAGPIIFAGFCSFGTGFIIAVVLDFFYEDVLFFKF